MIKEIEATKSEIVMPIPEKYAEVSSYRILGTGEFYFDFFNEIQAANDRVLFQTMAFENGHFSSLLTHHLINAQKRGVNVQFVHDAYSDYVTDNTFNHLPALSREDQQYKQFALRETQALLNSLKSNDIKPHKTNSPTGPHRITPLPGAVGRDHKKIVVVDNIAYIGGVNFTELDAKRFDFMIKITNPSIVNNLSKILNDSLSDQPQSDHEIICDSNNTLVIDGGHLMKSLIMKNAYQLVDKEKDEIVVISPFLPTGKFAAKLNHAVESGVKVSFITSSRESLPGFASKVSQFVHNFGTGSQKFSTIYADGIVHAKALIALGNSEAIIGSHNFDELFVKLGTEEIALRTKEVKIIEELKRYLLKIKYL